MRKEIIYAIIAGLVFGLLVAFGIWRINVALSPKKTDNVQLSSDQDKNTGVSVVEPSENDVLSASPATINGIIEEGSLLVISDNNKDYLSTLDNKGSFSTEVNLTGGINKFTLASINKKGEIKSKSLTLIYSSEFAKIIPTALPTEKDEVNDSTDSVRQKVEQKVLEAQNSPTGYIGTVTDITGATIQLKNSAGEIQQISTEENPTVIKDGTTVKAAKLTDIAIGDYIVAMGFRNGNHVLASRRILITSVPEIATHEYVLGTIIQTKSQISFKLVKDEKEFLLTPAGSTATAYLKENDNLSKIRFANIRIDDTFVAVGSFKNNSFQARSVFVVNRP